MSKLVENLLFRYFVEAYKEIRKVTWPSRDQLTASTIVVIVFSLTFAIFLGLMDFLLNQVLQLVIS